MIVKLRHSFLCLCCFNVGYGPTVIYGVKVPIELNSSMRINSGNFLLVGFTARGCQLLPAVAECSLTLLMGLSGCDHITATQQSFHLLPMK